MIFAERWKNLKWKKLSLTYVTQFDKNKFKIINERMI